MAEIVVLNRIKEMTEEQRIALGFRPRTLRGWLFWLRYWSPPALWWLRRTRGEH